MRYCHGHLCLRSLRIWSATLLHGASVSEGLALILCVSATHVPTPRTLTSPAYLSLCYQLEDLCVTALRTSTTTATPHLRHYSSHRYYYSNPSSPPTHLLAFMLWLVCSTRIDCPLPCLTAPLIQRGFCADSLRSQPHTFPAARTPTSSVYPPSAIT